MRKQEIIIFIIINLSINIFGDSFHEDQYLKDRSLELYSNYIVTHYSNPLNLVRRIQYSIFDINKFWQFQVYDFGNQVYDIALTSIYVVTYLFLHITSIMYYSLFYWRINVIFLKYK